MNIEDARLYCLSKQDATEDFPFDETTLAFRVENKIFAIVDLENTEWFCVKCDADKAVELRDTYSQIKPAWHMNKRYWNMMDIKKPFEFYWKMFLYSRFYFGFFESVFGIFSLLSFGNSPLFPAKQQRKSTQKQFSNNSEIKFKQLLSIWMAFLSANLSTTLTKRYLRNSPKR